jgi:hypothetical protein
MYMSALRENIPPSAVGRSKLDGNQVAVRLLSSQDANRRQAAHHGTVLQRPAPVLTATNLGHQMVFRDGNEDVGCVLDGMEHVLAHCQHLDTPYRLLAQELTQRRQREDSWSSLQT